MSPKRRPGSEQPEGPDADRLTLLKPVLATRDEAKALRERHGIPSQIDFARVEIAAPPFLDEYLGRMMEDCRDRGLELPELVNVPDEVRVSIELVLEGRGIDYKFPAEAAS